jgi:hypothetical protein
MTSRAVAAGLAAGRVIFAIMTATFRAPRHAGRPPTPHITRISGRSSGACGAATRVDPV